jgi:hypothetical protein
MKSRLRSARFGGAESSNDAIDISQEPTEPFEEPAISVRFGEMKESCSPPLSSLSA